MRRIIKTKSKEYRDISFNYHCFDCNEDFILELKRGKDKDKKVCPMCGKKDTKCMGENPLGAVKVKGGGDELNRGKRKLEKFVRDGLGKEEAEKFYRESIAASKERMKSGGDHYEKVLMCPEELRAQGKAKKVSDMEARKKMEVAQTVTRDAAKKARWDVTTGNKQGTLGIVEKKGKD